MTTICRYCSKAASRHRLVGTRLLCWPDTETIEYHSYDPCDMTTILDKTSVYGLRVTIDKSSETHYVVSTFNADTNELLRTKSAASDKMARIWADRQLQ